MPVVSIEMFRLFTGTEPKSCAYFDQLSDGYGYRPNVTPLATSSSSGAGDTGQDMKDDAASSDEETSSVLKKAHYCLSYACNCSIYKRKRKEAEEDQTSRRRCARVDGRI